MEPAALSPTPLEHEVLELVRHHLHSMEQRLRAGAAQPDDAARARELQRIAELVRARMANRQHLADARNDEEPDGNLPNHGLDPLQPEKLLKKLEEMLTTVQPDGTTMAEQVKDREGVTQALKRSAALHQQLTADLEQQRRLEAVAERALEQVRDTLLLWKVNNASFGSGGAQA
jgi:hypothetical protein